MNFKSLLSLVLFLFFYSSILQSQTYKPTKDKLYQSLIGEVHMLALFVDTNEDYWEDDEKEYFQKQYDLSQKWLIDQAANYDQELEFNNETFFIENFNTIHLDEIKRGQNPKRTIAKVLEELGYDDFEDFQDRNSFDFKEEKLKVLLFVKSYDRSHAYDYFSNAELDLAIVYSRSSYGMIKDHLVISHEVLHQFGAWDLYQGRSQTLKNARRLRELFPNSIMIDTYRHKKEKEVDHLTAWRVGWHIDLDDEYMDFAPGKSRGKPTAKERTYQRKSQSENGLKFNLKRKKKKKKESDNKN